MNKILFKPIFTFLLINLMFAKADAGELIQKPETRTGKEYIADTAAIKQLNQLSEKYLYNNTDSAMYFAQAAMRQAQAQKNITGQATSLNNIGRVYYVQGNYVAAMDAAAKLMSISQKVSYQQGIGSAFHLMGLVYLTQNKFNDAIASFESALKIFVPLKTDTKTSRLYFNLAVCYDESGSSEKAFYYLDKATVIARHLNDSVLIAMIQSRTGNVYFHLKNYTQALIWYQRVTSSSSASNWEKGFAYSGLAQTYYGLKQYDKAILSAQQSLAVSKKVRSQSDAIRALEILSESYAAVNNYKQAYNYQVLFKKANDSLFNNEKEKEINYLHLKQQQADNVLLKSDIRDKEHTISLGWRLFVIRNLVALCFIAFVVIIIRNSRQKTGLNTVLQKQNQNIEQQKEEISKQKEALKQLNYTKDQLFSVISHDLRSPFAAILQTIDLIRSGDIPYSEQMIIMDNFYQQVTTVSLMVNNLLVWASGQQLGIKSDLIELDIAKAVNEIVSVSSFLAKNKNISLYHHYEGEKLVLADWNHVKIIIQNIIGNAIKFTPSGGAIEIFYSEDETSQVIHIKDTGIGISPEKMDKLFKVIGKEISGYGTNNEAGAGIGLVLIKQFVEVNKGRLHIKSEPGSGTEFSVYLQKAIAAPVSVEQENIETASY